jgi:hypothetical protein
MVPAVEFPLSLTSVPMLPLPCCTGPDQVPETEAGSVTVGDGDAAGDDAEADGEPVCDAAGRLAESGVAPELAFCRTCTATAIASTQTAAAATQPTALDRRRPRAGPGRATPGAGSAGARMAALAARLDPSASTPAGGLSWPMSRTTTCRAAGRAAGSDTRQLATMPRSGSGSAGRPAAAAGLPPLAANKTVRAHASMSAAGVAAP